MNRMVNTQSMTLLHINQILVHIHINMTSLRMQSHAQLLVGKINKAADSCAQRM